MDIRIDGLHEKALVRLMERNGEKTGVAMARLLIRDAAREAGIWLETEPDSGSESVTVESLSVPTMA